MVTRRAGMVAAAGLITAATALTFLGGSAGAVDPPLPSVAENVHIGTGLMPVYRIDGQTVIWKFQDDDDVVDANFAKYFTVTASGGNAGQQNTAKRLVQQQALRDNACNFWEGTKLLSSTKKVGQATATAKPIGINPVYPLQTMWAKNSVNGKNGSLHINLNKFFVGSQQVTILPINLNKFNRYFKFNMKNILGQSRLKAFHIKLFRGNNLEKELHMNADGTGDLTHILETVDVGLDGGWPKRFWNYHGNAGAVGPLSTQGHLADDAFINDVLDTDDDKKNDNAGGSWARMQGVKFDIDNVNDGDVFTLQMVGTIERLLLNDQIGAQESFTAQAHVATLGHNCK